VHLYQDVSARYAEEGFVSLDTALKHVSAITSRWQTRDADKVRQDTTMAVERLLFLIFASAARLGPFVPGEVVWTFSRRARGEGRARKWHHFSQKDPSCHPKFLPAICLTQISLFAFNHNLSYCYFPTLIIFLSFRCSLSKSNGSGHTAKWATIRRAAKWRD
jgi:hypothetical protein